MVDVQVQPFVQTEMRVEQGTSHGTLTPLGDRDVVFIGVFGNGPVIEDLVYTRTEHP